MGGVLVLRTCLKFLCLWAPAYWIGSHFLSRNFSKKCCFTSFVSFCGVQLFLISNVFLDIVTRLKQRCWYFIQCKSELLTTVTRDLFLSVINLGWKCEVYKKNWLLVAAPCKTKSFITTDSLWKQLFTILPCQIRLLLPFPLTFYFICF